MGQWHCAIDGKKYGPIDEQTLQSWINEGRLKLTDMIWAEGMEQWQPVSNFPQFSAAVGSVPPVDIPGVQGEGQFVPAPTGGTNGTTKVLEITAAAHQSLKGRWGLPIGFCLLLGLLNYAVVTGPNHIINITTAAQETSRTAWETPRINQDTLETTPRTFDENYTFDVEEDSLYFPERRRPTFRYTAFTGNVISLFVTGAFSFGYVVFFLTFMRGGQPRLGQMFDGFKIYGKTLGAHLLMSLFILLWTLLFIIPGMIAAYAYSQTFYIIADNPSIRVREAIKRSKEMMKGHKWRLFCMGLWFFLLSILCVFTLFIGFLWLVPYMQASYAKFYEDLQPPLNAPAAA